MYVVKKLNKEKRGTVFRTHKQKREAGGGGQGGSLHDQFSIDERNSHLPSSCDTLIELKHPVGWVIDRRFLLRIDGLRSFLDTL